MKASHGVFVIEYPDLFSSEECLKIKAIIYSLERYWDLRNSVVPFFTLGTPGYLDANPLNLQYSYLSKVSKRNPVLSENLGWMSGTFLHQVAPFRIRGLKMNGLRFKDTWLFIMARGIFTGEETNVLHTWLG